MEMRSCEITYGSICCCGELCRWDTVVWRAVGWKALPCRSHVIRHSSMIVPQPFPWALAPIPCTHKHSERPWARSSWGWRRPRGSMRLSLQLLLQRPGSVIIRGTICRPGLACPVPCGARATPIGQNEMTRRELHISLNISLDMPNLHLPPSR